MQGPDTPPRLTGVVLDFDGTVTEGDIGDLICDRFADPFADPSWQEIDGRWVRGELSLQEAQRQMWALCRCQRDEALAFAREVGHLRPGLLPFLRQAQAAGVPVWLASGGFDFYIEAILGDEGLGLLSRRTYNTARFVGGGIEVGFPHKGLSCSRCAVCKGAVVDRLRGERGGQVAFVGDGYSDRCVLDHGSADRLCVVEGSHLARLAQDQGINATRFSDFQQLGGALFS